jgi:hypothetical protein
MARFDAKWSGWVLAPGIAAWVYACGGPASQAVAPDGGDATSQGDGAQPEGDGSPTNPSNGDVSDSTVGDEASVDGSADGGSDARDAGSTPDAIPAEAEAGPDASPDEGSPVGLDAAAEADAQGDGGTAAFDGGCGPCTGSVVNGRCIETLATGQTTPYAIATDGVGVYWTNTGQFYADAGSVMRVSVCGGTPTPISAGVTSPGFITVDDRRVYWTEDTSVMAWSKATGTISALASNQAAPAGIAVDGTSVYWSNDVADGGILRVPLDGGAPTTIVPHAGNPLQLVVSPTHVYWYQIGGDRVFFAPLSGGAEQLFFYDSNYYIAAIAIDGVNLYYTEQSSLGPLGVLPLDGGAPTSIANDNGTWGVVSDGTYVYYASPNSDAPTFDGAVVRVPLAGGTPTTLATGGYPEVIAIDATSVYWTSTRATSIMKVSPR